MFEGLAQPLSAAGVAATLDGLEVNAPALWAVLTVETKGCGFLPDRRPAILFERHWFSRMTNRKFDAQAPDVSNPSAGGYIGGAKEHDRLQQAVALDRPAALQSASWGLGQVMGFNAAKAGFADAEAMVQAFLASEGAQLAAMAAFIAQAGLASHLRAGDWAKFAYRCPPGET